MCAKKSKFTLVFFPSTVEIWDMEWEWDDPHMYPMIPFDGLSTEYRYACSDWRIA